MLTFLFHSDKQIKEDYLCLNSDLIEKKQNHKCTFKINNPSNKNLFSTK
jgi:hypothetical protein